MEARVKVLEELAVSYDQKWQEAAIRSRAVVGLEDELDELWVQLLQLGHEIQEQRHLIVELRYKVLEQEEAASYNQRKEVEKATTYYDQKVLLAMELAVS